MKGMTRSAIGNKRASPLSPLTYLYRARSAEARRNIYFGLKGKNWKEAHGFKGRLKIVYADGPSKGVLGRIVQFYGAEPSSD